ncbi:MAG TPA: trypsin-like serine protease, partial [Actinophytocola sp.]|uniref:trypsin-like serine protease n=1 Tax=Actinophytocola sp. TaxID=1872138 RepID=UPI002E019F90|nr:trypsin-like serine protease [Actinophytocola sp.]
MALLSSTSTAAGAPLQEQGSTSSGSAPGGFPGPAIIGGEEVTANASYLAALHFRDLKDASELVFSCSGLVVGSEWVLTALHCVTSVLEREYVVRAFSLDRTSGGVLANVTEINPSPLPSGEGGDAVLLRVSPALSGPFPDGVVALPASAELNSGGRDLTNMTVWTYGWGVNATGATPEIIHRVDGNIGGFPWCRNEDGKVVMTGAFPGFVCVSHPDGNKPQPGDSGGAVLGFQDGQTLVWGTHSRMQDSRFKFDTYFTPVGAEPMRSWFTNLTGMPLVDPRVTEPFQLQVTVSNEGRFVPRTTVSAGYDGAGKSTALSVGTNKVDLGAWNSFTIRGESVIGRYAEYQYESVGNNSRLCFEYTGTTLVGFDFYRFDCDTGVALSEPQLSAGLAPSFYYGLAGLVVAAGTLVGVGAKVMSRLRRSRAAAATGTTLTTTDTTTAAGRLDGRTEELTESYELTVINAPTDPIVPATLTEVLSEAEQIDVAASTNDTGEGTSAGGALPVNPVRDSALADPVAIRLGERVVASLPNEAASLLDSTSFDDSGEAFVVIVGIDSVGNPMLFRSDGSAIAADAARLAQYIVEHRPEDWSGEHLRVLTPQTPSRQEDWARFQQIVDAAIKMVGARLVEHTGASAPTPSDAPYAPISTPVTQRMDEPEGGESLVGREEEPSSPTSGAAQTDDSGTGTGKGKVGALPAWLADRPMAKLPAVALHAGSGAALPRELGWIARVNPWRDVPGPVVDPTAFWANCVLSVIATAMTLTDRASGLTTRHQAGGAKAAPRSDLERHAGRQGRPATFAEIVTAMAVAADGDHGIVEYYVAGAPHRHAVNVVNTGGRIVFLDGHAGGLAHLPADAQEVRFIPMFGLTGAQRASLTRQNLIALDNTGGRDSFFEALRLAAPGKLGGLSAPAVREQVLLELAAERMRPPRQRRFPDLAEQDLQALAHALTAPGAWTYQAVAAAQKVAGAILEADIAVIKLDGTVVPAGPAASRQRPSIVLVQLAGDAGRFMATLHRPPAGPDDGQLLVGGGGPDPDSPSGNAPAPAESDATDDEDIASDQEILDAEGEPETA